MARAAGSSEGTSASGLSRKISAKPSTLDATTGAPHAIAFLSIDDLLGQHGEGAAPFILKMDIEGFEQDGFSGETSWLDRFYLAAIELHDWMLPGAASSWSFLSAVAALDRDFLFRGENVFSISNRKPGS